MTLCVISFQKEWLNIEMRTSRHTLENAQSTFYLDRYPLQLLNEAVIQPVGRAAEINSGNEKHSLTYVFQVYIFLFIYYCDILMLIES